MEALLSLSKGDMRRALNILQVGTFASLIVLMMHALLLESSHTVTCVEFTCILQLMIILIFVLPFFFFTQSTSLAYNDVSEQSVYECTGQPLPTDIALIVEWMLNDSFKDAYQSEKDSSSSVRIC